MTSADQYDIAIVGAGPAGATLARLVGSRIAAYCSKLFRSGRALRSSRDTPGPYWGRHRLERAEDLLARVRAGEDR